MEPQEHPEADPGPERSWPRGEDVLRDLEQRLDRASEAAERLLAEASGRAARAGADASAHAAGTATDAPPAAGWQSPEEDARNSGRELELLLGIVASLRDLVPAELQQRLAEALRELLLAIRALIDWYLERVERRRAEPSEVQDIPIR